VTSLVSPGAVDLRVVDILLQHLALLVSVSLDSSRTLSPLYPSLSLLLLVPRGGGQL
jgi:hypothetical protein